MTLKLTTYAAVLALTLAGSTPAALAAADAAAPSRSPPPSATLDRALEDRILALDPEHLGAADVRMLAAGPAPRIILLHGGVFPVHLLMESFGQFLTGMGYPEARIRDPGDNGWSYSPYQRTAQLAGLIAWQYEHDGMRPMLIGHSQGGLSAVKILKDLAGQNGDRINVWNPLTATLEDRTTIVDPLTGQERPVVGLSVAYASAVGAGGFALVLPGWWENLATLRRIPDTVDEFTGFFIEVDLFALSLPGNPLDSRYENSGNVLVRNVVLPATYNHVVVPASADLPGDPATRAWIDAYVPGAAADVSGLPADAQRHVLWAADVWYSIKKHWSIEAQRLIRTERGKRASN